MAVRGAPLGTKVSGQARVATRGGGSLAQSVPSLNAVGRKAGGNSSSPLASLVSGNKKGNN